MTITQVFFRIWKAVSFPLAAVALLLVYLSLPDQVAIQFNEAGRPVEMISKQDIFYWVVGILLVINLLLTAFGKSFSKLLPKVVSPKLGWYAAPKATAHLAEGWANGMAGTLNSFVLLALIGLYKANAKQDQILSVNLNWLMILGGTMLLLVLFYLPIQLLYSKPHESED
jgi:hypothetical protein